MEKEQGIVIEAYESIAKIKGSRHSHCENCGGCPGDNSIIIEAVNNIGAKTGQLVEFEMKATGMIKSSFIVFVLPLLLVFAGVIIGDFFASKWGLNGIFMKSICGVIGFVLSIFIIKIYDRMSKSNNKFKPSITKILSE